MRSIGWFLGVVAALGWLGSAGALEMGCANCQSCAGGMPCEGTGFGAPPCAAPLFGGTPGCCQMAPTPCDNAWDGYCQERAFWQAIWYRVGTGTIQFGGWRRCQELSGPCYPPAGSVPQGYGQPQSVPSQAEPPLEPVPSVEPAGDVPPAPEPAEPRISWQWPPRWFAR